MKNSKYIRFISLFAALVLLISAFGGAFAAGNGFKYKHDPRLNPSAMADIIYDPECVYGFRPNPDSKRLGSYASYDWTDPVFVAESRQARIEYHESFAELETLRASLAAEGADIETIARAVSALRNEIRLRAYDNDPEGLAAVKASNLATYGNENGPTADSLYEQYGSWETVLEKAFSTNSGMDAILGLYDDYYNFFEQVGQVENTYYTEAMQSCYTNGWSDDLTDGVFTESETCTRAEAITLLWNAMGAPETEATELTFTDIDAESVCCDAVAWAYANGITTGTSETTFSPDEAVTRAQLVTFINRCAKCEKAEAENCFADVSEEDYFYSAVIWAAYKGIARGTSETAFSPDDTCIRADAVTFIFRFAA